MIGADGRFVPAVGQLLGLERHRIIAQGLDGQFGQLLTDFRALYLQHGNFGANGPPRRLLGQETQVEVFQGGQGNFHIGDPAGISGVVRQTAAAELFLAGDFSQPAHPLLGQAHFGDGIAFMTQQEFGVGPALVLFADAVLHRHPDVGVIGHVQMMGAIDGDNRFGINPRRGHVDQQE